MKGFIIFWAMDEVPKTLEEPILIFSSRYLVHRKVNLLEFSPIRFNRKGAKKKRKEQIHKSWKT